jgi:hypothetical protein
VAGRWLTGWTLTGIIATPIFANAMNAGSSLAATALVVAGGAIAVASGAWVAAGQGGRKAPVDALLAGGAYVIASALFVALIGTGTAVQYNTYSSGVENRQFDPFLFAVYALVLFGGLFGASMARYYGRSIFRLAVAFAVVAVLAAVLTFYFALFFAGYNILTPLVGSAKVPLGLVSAGFLGMLLPGRIVEWQLRSARRPHATPEESAGFERSSL